MVTDKVIYSYSDKYDNFVAAFHSIDISKIEEVLILGYGLGSITDIFEKLFKQYPNIWGVEIDAEIIRLAETYHLPSVKSKVELIEFDAHLFMSYYDQKHDMICVDIFINEIVPNRFKDLSFLKTVKKGLSKNGVAIMNMLYLFDADKQETNQFYKETWQKVFQNSKFVTTRTNFICIGFK